MHYAARIGKEIVKELLAKKANAADANGKTPLNIARENEWSHEQINEVFWRCSKGKPKVIHSLIN